MEDSADPVSTLKPDRQSAAPFFEALAAYVEGDVLGFHMPGHGQGRGLPRPFHELLARHGMAADITQVLGMDDILHPESVTGYAQELAAELYGADQTYFLVNGSSVGIHAMLLAALRPGETVLVPRNAHRSTLGGLQLSGARAVFYPVPFSSELGAALCADPADLEEALLVCPEAKALFLTTPSYYGATADVQRIVELAHGRGLLVLVDEAWGAHLRFHPELPPSALDAGADLVVQSTHKLLPGLSQAAMLHVRGPRVDRKRLRDALNLLQSTSPNTLLVASLDVARRQMAEEGLSHWSRVLDLCARAREQVNRLPGFRCFGAEMEGRRGCCRFDLSRLVISVPGTGFEWERYLRAEHNIQVEMSDLYNLVALVLPGHTHEELQRLVEALAAGPHGERAAVPSLSQPWVRPEMTLREAFDAPHRTVPAGQAVGKVCAEAISPYPPGIPVLLPGEVIQAEQVDILRRLREAGARLQGAADPELETIRVIDR